MEKRLVSLAGAVLAVAVGTLTIAQNEPEPVAPEAPAAENAEVGAPPVEAPKPDPSAQARRLVAELANESFRAREAATRELWELGEDGMDALEEGTASADPEVAYRSRILLQRIRTGITPGTPQIIVDLVQRYFTSGAAGKRGIFQELQREKAYAQMLRLYRFETDLAAREACDEVLSKSLLPAVLEELVADRVDAAEDLLRLAPATDQNCRRLAALLRVRGTLEDELQKTEQELKLAGDGGLVQRSRQMDVAALRLALLRASGKIADAQELAARMERSDLEASLALFEGDPVPYLNWFMKQEESSAIVRIHAEAVLKRWQGDDEGADVLMKNVAREARDGVDVDREALLSLLLNGYVDAALPILARTNEDSAFGYYETVELPLKALETKGYAGTEAEKAKWVEEHLQAIRGDWNNSEEERYDVLTVASFLNSRGLREEARQLGLALSEIALAEGETTWLEFLGRLNDFGSSLYELAFSFAAERLGADDPEKEAGKVIGALFGEGDSARRLWDRLEKSEQLPASERLLLLGGTYGTVYIEDAKLTAVLERLRAMAEEGEKEDRVQLLSDLLEAAETRDDAGAALALLGKLSELDESDTWVKKMAGYYAYVSDWEKATGLLEQILKGEPNNLRYLAIYGGALIRAGMPEKAAEPLQIVERFSLDEPIRLLRLAIDLEQSGAMDEAEYYWRTLITTNPPSDWYWQSSASYLAKHARLKKQWRVAAAFAEVDAMQYIKGRSTYVNPVTYIRKRFTADLYRGLALLQEGDKERAQKLLRSCFELLNGDGILADDYFPLLREAGLVEEHDRNFAIAYQRLEDSITAFPKAHNTYNSAAWMASRACRRLDDALEKITTALSMRPRQAAYLDTMAEVHFAMKDREKAVEWSWKAVHDSFHGGYSSAESGVGLREQYDRFRSGDFPVD